MQLNSLMMWIDNLADYGTPELLNPQNDEDIDNMECHLWWYV